MFSFGELFAGAGGMSLGLEKTMTPAWHVEVDPQCQRVLAARRPDVPLYGDVRSVSGGELAPVDLISGGFPCQNISVAGNGGGLDGDKSILFYEAMRVVKEMRDATGGLYPRVVLLENVANILSVRKGHDFGLVLEALGDAGALDIEWGVLDSRFFGVPQRRRRCFIVAWFDSRVAGGREVLPVAEGVPGDSGSGGRSQEVVAALTATGVGTCGADDNQAQAGHLIPTLTARCGSTFDDQQTGQLVVAFAENQAFSLSGHGGKPGQGYPAVLTGGGGSSKPMVAAPPEYQVRRLTPRECERLQGWPDDWTLVQDRKRLMADSPRYRMMGNGVTAPVAAWIGSQIVARLDSCS